jgi:hypothetical protein
MVIWTSTFATFFCTFAWLVNLDVALRFLAGGNGLYLQRIIPPAVYRVLARLAVDHSTVSTLLPLLLFAFPAGLGWWLRSSRSLPRWARPTHTPYPLWFTKFCIMAGMFGTLVGMWFGLPSIGTDANGAVIQVQKALTMHIEGFRTAIASSVVGLVVPCFAFCIGPVFRWAFPISSRQGDAPSLIAEFRDELGRLANAATDARAKLESLFKYLTSDLLIELAAQFRKLVKLVEEACATLLRIEASLTRNAEATEKLVKLVEELVKSQDAVAIESRSERDQMKEAFLIMSRTRSNGQPLKKETESCLKSMRPLSR